MEIYEYITLKSFLFLFYGNASLIAKELVLELAGLTNNHGLVNNETEMNLPAYACSGRHIKHVFIPENGK